jgi:hypothetical protein
MNVRVRPCRKSLGVLVRMMLIMLLRRIAHHGPVAVRVAVSIGDMQPLAYGHQGCGSQAARMMTGPLRNALTTIDIRVLDHIIAAGPKTTSFTERGWL